LQVFKKITLPSKSTFFCFAPYHYLEAQKQKPGESKKGFFSSAGRIFFLLSEQGAGTAFRRSAEAAPCSGPG